MYLVMEFIKGPTLYDHLVDAKRRSDSWEYLSSSLQVFILDSLLQIIHIIDLIHEKGYVHRDITPVNFLVTKKGRLVLIDSELAFSIKENNPVPPFEMGTQGFMSPEQMNVQTPTEKEDIYGFGATMIALLIGLPPIVFDSSNREQLRDNIYFFIRDRQMATTIADCIHLDPAFRPLEEQVTPILTRFREALNNIQRQMTFRQNIEKPNAHALTGLIKQAIAGLVAAPTQIVDDIWQSRGSLYGYNS